MRVVQSEASKETSARRFARGLAPRVFGGKPGWRAHAAWFASQRKTLTSDTQLSS